MAGIFSTTPYESFAGELDAALEWIGSFGISYEKTRLGEYKRAIDVLLEVYRARDLERTRNEFVRVTNAFFEVNDLITIYRSLSGKYDSEIKEHIKKYTKGPVNYREEVISASSNLARNIAFELLVASELVSANLEPDFSIGTDIAARFMRKSILFECKRPQTTGKLEANVKDAFKQLERKYRNPVRARHRGIIAVDISKIINPEYLFYVQPNAIALDRGLSQIINHFIEDNERLWQLQRKNKTIAILIRVGIVGINQEKNDMLTYCQQYVLTPINNSGSQNIKTAECLANVLAGGQKMG